MHAEYKRDMNHNYLILYGEEEIDTGSYQVRMLVGNVLPSLLKCRVQGIDGKFMVYYDITSRQALSSLYEQKKFGMEDLRLIFGGFVQVMEEMSEYLLNPGHLVIRPEYIYLDVEKRELFFCYLPGFQKDVREQFRELTEYILPKLDHEEGKAVMLGYGVYRRALEDSFHLEHIKEELYQVRETGEQSPEEFTKRAEVTPERAEDIPETEGNFFRREEAEHTPKLQGIWRKILGWGVGTAVVLGIVAAKFLGYLPRVTVEMILGAVLAGMGAGMLIYTVRKKKKGTTRNTGDVEHSGRECGQHFAMDFQRDAGLGEEKPRPVKKGKDPDSERIFAGQGEEEDRDLKKEELSESFGETVVLSACPAGGPATLVSREPGELATIYLKEDMTVIGKLETASDAVINLPTVSRVHAKIKKREEEYYLSDLNSRNGTSVNGRLLKGEEEYRLQDQDEVDFAQARYVFLK